MTNGKFALYLCGAIVIPFLVGLVVYFVSRPYLGEWAVAPTLAVVATISPFGGKLLFKASNARRADALRQQ